MNLILRVLLVSLGVLYRPRLKPTDISHLRLRVWPHDLDFNLHMTNSRYFAIMDLGRLDLILRAGIWRLMHKHRLAAVLGARVVRYRRELKPFEPFTLQTRLLGWDEAWVYLEQTMHGREGLACIAIQRAGFIRTGKLTPPSELALGPPQPLPAWVADWNKVEGVFATTAGSSEYV